MGMTAGKIPSAAPPGRSGGSVRARFGACYTGRVRLDSATGGVRCQIPSNLS